MPPFFSINRESDKADSLKKADGRTELQSEEELPPIVARMVVEIRSDGTRTIARGALEDLKTGERVALQANAKSPVALARELTKAILMTPVLAGDLAKQAVLDLLPEAVKNRRGFGLSKLGLNKKRKRDKEK